MNYTINACRLAGKVTAIPSKSHLHRQLIAAALYGTDTEIRAGAAVGRYCGNRKLSGCSGRADPQIGKRSDPCQSNQGKTQGGRRPAAFLQRKRFYASVSFARGMRAGAPCGILSGGPSSRQAAVSAARRADPARLPDFRARKRAALCRRRLVWRRF